MKFCLSNHLMGDYLRKADEIKVNYKEFTLNTGLIIIENYPQATVIVDCHGIDDIDWEAMEKADKLFQHKLIMCVNTIQQLDEARAHNLRRYLGWPISSFWELEGVSQYGVEYVKLDMELFFDMPSVKRAGIPIRVVPNVCYTDGMPHNTGIIGRWIRPEDLWTTYADYVDAVEFEDCDMNKEQALFRIYAEQKEWRQPLKVLFTNMETDAVGRLIIPEVAEARLRCQHRCVRDGSCQLCVRAFNLAVPDKIKTLRDLIDNSKKL